MVVYNSLQKGLGTAFLLLFGVYQVSMVTGFFMAISTNFSDFYANDGWWVYLIMTSVYLFAAIFDMICLYVITMAACDAYDSLRTLGKALELTLMESADLREREQIRLLIKEIENVQPFNGNGYFTITKSTLTSMASTSITYLIILLQFRKI